MFDILYEIFFHSLCLCIHHSACQTTYSRCNLMLSHYPCWTLHIFKHLEGLHKARQSRLVHNSEPQIKFFEPSLKVWSTKLLRFHHINKAITHLKMLISFFIVRKLCTFNIKLIHKAITRWTMDKSHVINNIVSIYHIKSILNASNRNMREKLIITYSKDHSSLVQDEFVVSLKSIDIKSTIRAIEWSPPKNLIHLNPCRFFTRARF